MVRPLTAKSRPARAAALKETSPAVENSPVGDGSWVQPSEDSTESNGDITIDPEILNMLIPTTPNITVNVNQAIQGAEAISSIPETVVEPLNKEVKPKRVPVPTPRFVPKTALKSTIPKSPETIPDSASFQDKDEVDRSSVVYRKGSPERQENATSKGSGKSTFQEPATNYFSSDYQYPEGVQRDVAAQGRDLYLRFLHEEMRVVRVPEPPCMDPWREARLDLDYSVSLNASVRIRRSLRQLADVFATSDHRERVRARAAEVDLESLNLSAFNELLCSLCQEGGMTSERIIVLFFFCADLTIRALTEQLIGCFHLLVEWSQLYIVDTVSVWVQENGGWSAVLEQSSDYIYKAAKIALACATIVALCVYVRRGR